jgi:hypothetical protein
MREGRASDGCPAFLPLIRAARSLLAALIQIPFADCREVRLPNFPFFEGEFLRGVLAFWVAEFGGQDRLAPAK